MPFPLFAFVNSFVTVLSVNVGNTVSVSRSATTVLNTPTVAASQAASEGRPECLVGFATGGSGHGRSAVLTIAGIILVWTAYMIVHRVGMAAQKRVRKRLEEARGEHCLDYRLIYNLGYEGNSVSVD
ncbi:unnamed protein product [Somion occarium]|uniref:Transmembrane protein n=1 Tax=Somion occarium TaxID=3059160 RepID=A0ABP1CTK2_9APHY